MSPMIWLASYTPLLRVDLKIIHCVIAFYQRKYTGITEDVNKQWMTKCIRISMEQHNFINILIDTQSYWTRNIGIKVYILIKMSICCLLTLLEPLKTFKLLFSEFWEFFNKIQKLEAMMEKNQLNKSNLITLKFHSSVKLRFLFSGSVFFPDVIFTKTKKCQTWLQRLLWNRVFYEQ